MNFDKLNPVDYIFRTEIETYVDEHIAPLGQGCDRDAMIKEMEKWVKDSISYDANNIQTNFDNWLVLEQKYVPDTNHLWVDDYMKRYEEGTDLFLHVESYIINIYEYDIAQLGIDYVITEDTKIAMKLDYAEDARKEYKWLLDKIDTKKESISLEQKAKQHYHNCFNQHTYNATRTIMKKLYSDDMLIKVDALLIDASRDVCRIAIDGHENGKLRELAKMMMGQGAEINLQCVAHLKNFNSDALNMWIYIQNQYRRSSEC